MQSYGIRFAGVLGYTHVVLESWGGMEFQCLKELGWKGFTFTKAQLEDIIKEMRAFKMEIIPMVNCLGHASLSRVDIGKHVVLDQNLLLSDYFLKYGWVWNFKKQKADCVMQSAFNIMLCPNTSIISYFFTLVKRFLC